MGDVLTKELVRAARNMMGGVSCNALGLQGVVLPVSVADLCETCDALRVEVERLRAEVETWVKVAEVKNQQLDAYDEKAAQAEMVAIERSACQAAMQKMDDLRVVAEAALARAEAAERERDEAKESRNKAWAEKDKEVEGRNVWEERAQESHRECERRDAWAKRLRLRAEAAEAREAGLRTDAAAVLLAINEARMLDAALVLRRMARAAAPAKGDRTLPQDWRERVLRDALERIAKCGPGSVDGECEDCDSECIEQANIAQVALAETAPAKEGKPCV